jgi:hypothetical protein
VVVLSPEFVKARHPMRELAIFLERKARDPSGILLIPVFIGLNAEQLDDLEGLCHSQPWPQEMPQPGEQERAESLKEWAAAVEQLRLQPTVAWSEEVGGANGFRMHCRIQHLDLHRAWPCLIIGIQQTQLILTPGKNRDQLPLMADLGHVCGLTLGYCLQQNHFEGKLAGVVADAVVEYLITTKRLPESCRSRDAVDMSRVMLSRPGNLQVVGRDGEVQRVIEALTGDAGAAVLVGGPGEGKSTVAMEAGLELCKRGWFPGGAFVVDFFGGCEQHALPPCACLPI